jgi:group II intron reverse transcriptase/maturase
VPHHTAPGSDGQTAEELQQDFVPWSEATLRAVHTQGYRPLPVRRTYIPKPGKRELRPLGVPCIGDRVLQRSVADVLSAIYEQDFLPCSFGGRPGVGAHHALATLHEVIAGKPVSWIYEADLRNFFGSLEHGWLLRFVQHRVGDPRILCLIRRWLKAGVLEGGVVEPSEEGVPQGGNISVVLSNLYLHYVLDLWFERVVKPRLQGEAYLIRYLDDFVVCFQLSTRLRPCTRLGRPRQAARMQNHLPPRQGFPQPVVPPGSNIRESGLGQVLRAGGLPGLGHQERAGLRRRGRVAGAHARARPRPPRGSGDYNNATDGAAGTREAVG